MTDNNELKYEIVSKMTDTPQGKVVLVVHFTYGDGEAGRVVLATGDTEDDAIKDAIAQSKMIPK